MSVLESYAKVLKRWPAAAGRRPTKAEFEKAHQLGSRAGTSSAVGIAMMLRPKKGATQSEIKAVTGGPQLNRAHRLVETKRARRVDAPQRGGHTVYLLRLHPRKR